MKFEFKWPSFLMGKKKMVYDRGRYKEANKVGSVSEKKGEPTSIGAALKSRAQTLSDIDAEIMKQYK